jgi:hypothetical protein
MKPVLRKALTSLVVALAAVSIVALPNALASGICEDLCGICFSNEQHPCAYLDGCSVSQNECYFISGDCETCKEITPP